MNNVKTAIENIEKELATLKEWEVKIDAYFAVTRTYKEIGAEINSLRDVIEEMKHSASHISSIQCTFESMIEDAQKDIDNAFNLINDAYMSIKDAQEDIDILNDRITECFDNIPDLMESIENMEEIIDENEEIYYSIDIRDAYEQICDIMNDNDNEEAF